jgi:hypothetical protein
MCMYVCFLFYFFIYWLNRHAPLHSSNTTCFIVRLCYYFDTGDAVTRLVSGFPLQVLLLHRFILVPLKVTSAVITIDQSLSILRTVKMILGALRLFLVYLPASYQTLRHCAWIFLFVDLVSHTDIVNGLRFDLRYHRGSLLFLEFWSGGDKTWFSRGLSPSLWGSGFVHVCMYIHMCMYVHVCMYCVCVCVYVLCMYVHMYVCMYVFMYVCN